MEVNKDMLKVTEIIGYNDLETIIDSKIYLKSIIDRILWLDVGVSILNSKINRDRISITGLVKFKLVYKDTEGEILIEETSEEFHDELEIQGATDEMTPYVDCKLEYKEEDIVDENKVDVRAIISIMGKVEATRQIELIRGIENIANLETLKEEIKYKDIIIKEVSHTDLEDVYEIDDNMPPVDQILKLSLNAYENEHSLTTDKLIISGILDVNIIYLGGGVLNSIGSNRPFTHFIDLEGIESFYESSVDIEILGGDYEVKENIEGYLKVIDINAKLKIHGEIYEIKTKDLLMDAYSTEEVIFTSKEEVNISQNFSSFIHRELIKETIEFANIQELYLLEGKPIVRESSFLDNKVVLEGILPLTIYYSDYDLNVNTMAKDLDFRAYIPVEDYFEDISIDIKYFLEEIDWLLENGKIDITANVKAVINIKDNRIFNLVKELDQTGEEIDKSNRPSISIYIIQRDDSLWDIAKRYNTTVEEIMESNGISSPNTIMPLEKIIIEKKVNIDF